VELADIILVNKTDGDLAAAARHAASDYRSALQFLRPTTPNWTVPVETCSALTGVGIAEAWDTVLAFQKALSAEDALGARRVEQARAWLWNEIGDTLLSTLKAHDAIREIAPALEDQVAQGTITPSMAAQMMLRKFLGDG
jgi:LAO/AO transport system kinase